ncbi:MAG: fibronectin type III domain-containing protein [Acidimicrobiia bacterium]|nr:fibronectin type III domain-containing protein [Acidimicrobiia bacterium]
MADTGKQAVRLAIALSISVAGFAGFDVTARAAVPDTDTPVLRLARTIRTTPFTGTSSSMRDGEGSAYVPNDPAHPNIGGTGSLWLSEDNGRAVWEVDPATGALKSSIRDATWQATKQFDPNTGTGTGSAAGSNRDPDLESMAYDRATDTLYAFSGKCCTSSVLPTVFRLRRGTDHTFHPESFQAFPSGSDFTAAAWHPDDHSLYVGVGSDLRTYDYVTNTPGSTFRVSGLSSIRGMTFSDDGRDLFVANASVKVLRVDWATKALRSGWSLDLKPFGMLDSRAVEVIGDQLFLLDGYDSQSSGDPLRYAVFVFDVCCSEAGVPGAPGTPTATPGVGAATVSFTPPTSDGGSPVTGYDVRATPGGATCATTTLSCTIVGLAPGTSYRFSVTAKNIRGPGPASALSPPVVALAAQFTVNFSATEISYINQAADYFGIPRVDALRHGARIVRFIDALTQPHGVGPFTPPVLNPGPGTVTANYTDPNEVVAMEQLAARLGLTMTEFHDVGADHLIFLWWVNTH